MEIEKQLKERMNIDNGYLIPSYSKLYRDTINLMIKPFKNKKIDKIISPEMKGMFYGPTIAYKLKIPFSPIFKAGRIPRKIAIGKSYKDYSKKEKRLEIGKIQIKKGEKILIVDDIFESGKSGKAMIQLIEKLGGKIIGISIVYNKLKSKDEQFFKKYNFKYIIK